MRASHRIRTLVAGVSTAVLMLGAIAVGAAPAQAQTVTGFGNGTVGIPQTIQVNDLCPNASLSLVATYASGVQVSSPAVNSDDDGNATIFWTPNLAGVITSAAIGSVCGPFAIGSATIAPVGTVTAIAAANTASVGVPTLITVTVQSASPSTYQPTGTVTVRNGGGAVVVTMGLTAAVATNGQSFAYFRFTPPAVGTYLFQATYSGDAGASGSVSPVDTLAATTSGGTISLTAPSTMTVGVPVNLIANVVPTNVAGSVGFTFNGSPISASIQLVNGQASFLWTPTVAGNAVLGASYTTNGGNSGSTTDRVAIVAGPVARDVITLTQPGVGPWAPNGNYTLGNGTAFAFQASTLSGAPVSLTESGPCQVSGLTLTIDTGSGQCNLVASSSGGAGYAPVQQGYTISMVPGQQTARLAAPNSGRFGVGRTLRLQNPAQGTTSAGQNVTWRVTSGASQCRLVYPRSGAVNVRLSRAGQCTVVARAAAVPNSWQAFQLRRTYTAR